MNYSYSPNHVLFPMRIFVIQITHQVPNNYTCYKCGMKLLINPRSLTWPPLRFWKWISALFLHFTGYVITYQWGGVHSSHVSKTGPKALITIHAKIHMSCCGLLSVGHAVIRSHVWQIVSTWIDNWDILDGKAVEVNVNWLHIAHRQLEIWTCSLIIAV